MLTRPSRRTRRGGGSCRAAARRTPRSRSAGRRSGSTPRRSAPRARDPRGTGRISAGAERAVDADHERLGVLDGDPERLGRLTREVAAAASIAVKDDPQRSAGRDLGGGDERGLRVERVEDGLDQQQVDAALDEPAHLLGVGLDDLVERHGPVAGVVDLGRERERDVERADRAGHEAAAGLVGCLAREPRAFDVHLVDGVLEPVVGLADPRRREGVGRRDVGARLQVRRGGCRARPRAVSG